MSSPAGVKRNADHISSSPTIDNNKKPKSNGSITSFFGAPKAKPTGAQPATASSSFNKQKWVDSLTQEQKDLLQLEINTMDESWLARLKDEVVTPEFLALKQFLKKEKEAGVKIFPPENEIYSWTRHTPLTNVKVIVVGQDPYHNDNQAHGLAFSVRPPTPAPPSLVNIYTGIKNDYPSFKAPPKNGGLLTPWAERGVLMLNACLTVRAHQANSHSNKGWERFTQKVIDLVARVRTRGVVFLAWGAPAGKRVAGIDRQRHCVLQSAHPSPLSAYRGFFNCGHFKKCNEWLAQRYGQDETIDWDLVPKKDGAELPTPASTSTIPSSKEKEPVKNHSTPQKQPAVETNNPKTIIQKSTDDDAQESEDDADALEALIATTEGNEQVRDPATKSELKPDSKENDPPVSNDTVSA